MFKKSILFLAAALCSLSAVAADYLTYEGSEGPGVGKHIVFIANDHEYRSEETCPLLAKLLAKHQGFKCTVLFGIDENGFIKAGAKGVPGMEILEEADLVFFFTRFMNLSDEQADLLVDYFERGGPVVAARTSTHAFNGQKGKWAKLNFNYKGEDYSGGLGKGIFGNTWAKGTGQSHYGGNHTQGSKVIPVPGVEHPILTGVSPFHAYSGAYSSPVPAGATSLVDVQVLNTFHTSDNIATNKALVTAGWCRDSYTAPSGEGKNARNVYTSCGASEDLLDENTRRFLVNSCLWAIGMESEITADLNVDIVGKFAPSPYTTGAFFREEVKPSDLAGFDSSVMPTDKKVAGLDKKNGRAYKVLKQRLQYVESLNQVYPDFDLESYNVPSAKKKKKK